MSEISQAVRSPIPEGNEGWEGRWRPGFGGFMGLAVTGGVLGFFCAATLIDFPPVSGFLSLTLIVLTAASGLGGPVLYWWRGWRMSGRAAATPGLALAAVTFVFISLVQVNGRMDKSPARSVEAKVTERKAVAKSWGRQYLLALNWTGEDGWERSYELRIPEETFLRLPVEDNGTKVTLVTRPGFLGLEWADWRASARLLNEQ